jgi:hypothetical protein
LLSEYGKALACRVRIVIFSRPSSQMQVAALPGVFPVLARGVLPAQAFHFTRVVGKE